MTFALIGSAAPSALGDTGEQFDANDQPTVKVTTDPVTGQQFRLVSGGYSISADGSSITGTLPPGPAGAIGQAVETDPLDPTFEKRFKKAKNRQGLKRFNPKQATRSAAFHLDDIAGCVWNTMDGEWWSPHIDFKGWMTGCGYGTLNFNVWAKYFNSSTGEETNTNPRAYYGTTVCRNTRSCDGASHYVYAPSFGNGNRDMISRTHGWRTGGGDDTAWVWADYGFN